MDLPETNLLGFLGAEEQNLLTSMVKCHRDIAIAFPKLDGAFQAPIKLINIDDKYGYCGVTGHIWPGPVFH